MLTRSIALVGALLVSALVPAATRADTVVIGPSTVRGTTTPEGVRVFLGIPYAAPPVGENRWRPPQPAPAWPGVRDATDYANDCAQLPFPPDMAPVRAKTSEDCLYLNIWQPAGTKSGQKRPVMVWIHGGGFLIGGTSPEVYAGGAFARDGVVFVSINYRLGRFGFFAHPALDDVDFGGNFAFQDQIQALRWVQLNIAEFGGDPDNVTVFGESAGGMAVHMLLQSPEARGLFAKAIVESGGGRSTLMENRSKAAAAVAGKAFAPDANAAQLRAMPTAQVIGKLGLGSGDPATYSGPMIDGKTLLGEALTAARAGLYAPVPVMIGANSADGFPAGDDKEKLFTGFGADEARARALYDPKGDTPGLAAASAASADEAMIEPARAVARVLAPHQPVWLYRFAYQMPGDWARLNGGAPHASEIPYVFDTLAGRPEPATPVEQPTATLTHRYWVNFATCGAPDCAGDVPAWPRATAGDTTVQIIDADGARHAEDPFTARLDFAEERAERQASKR